MPICINPECGKTSRELTPLCTHCGQATLFAVDKSQTGTSKKLEISMELFEAEIEKFPAKAESEIRSKRRGFPRHLRLKFWNRIFKAGIIKKFFAVIIFASFFILSAISAAPNNLKNNVVEYLGIREKIPSNFNEEENQFKFLYVSGNGLPAYLNGCGTIPFYVRRNYATSNDLNLVKEGLRLVGKAYGRKFEFAGYTKATKVSGLPSSFLINFTDLQESVELRKQSKLEVHGVLGIGGPESYMSINSPRFGSNYFDKGTIQINGDKWPELTEEEKVALIMHEAGHVFGLDHPKNGMGQLMTGEPVSLKVGFGDGDLKGLRILSAVAGCREFPNYLQN